MKKEIPQTVPYILIKLADLLGAEIKNSRFEIPEQFGKGYIAGFIFNKYIRMIISNYELNEDILIKNPETDSFRRMIFFKFQNIFQEEKTFQPGKPAEGIPSVLIATSRIYTDDIISIHTNTATINIEVDAGYLKDLFPSTQESPILESLLQNSQPLLFEQIIYPSLKKIVDEIITEPVDKTFEMFFLRIKAEELVCRLLMELEKRDEKHLYALNAQDIKTIYTIKEKILKSLNKPPVISELAAAANMSPTKLKRLFKQVFGNSIFRYYQEFRMKEAARLLKEEKLSVSDTGYGLGFTNLSHFTRVFEEHIGIKPKKYSSKLS